MLVGPNILVNQNVVADCLSLNRTECDLATNCKRGFWITSVAPFQFEIRCIFLTDCGTDCSLCDNASDCNDDDSCIYQGGTCGVIPSIAVATPNPTGNPIDIRSEQYLKRNAKINEGNYSMVGVEMNERNYIEIELSTRILINFACMIGLSSLLIGFLICYTRKDDLQIV